MAASWLFHNGQYRNKIKQNTSKIVSPCSLKLGRRRPSANSCGFNVLTSSQARPKPRPLLALSCVWNQTALKPAVHPSHRGNMVASQRPQPCPTSTSPGAVLCVCSSRGFWYLRECEKHCVRGFHRDSHQLQFPLAPRSFGGREEMEEGCVCKKLSDALTITTEKAPGASSLSPKVLKWGMILGVVCKVSVMYRLPYLSN